MSGQWRFCVAAFLVVGFSTSAFSNPLTDLLNPAPKEAPPPAPAREACVQQPGASTAPGQHWFYRFDGHRKCWFQAAEAAVPVKRQTHHYPARQSVITSEDNEAALRKKTIADARAQMLSAAPPDVLQSAVPVPEVVDTASVAPNATATSVPSPPVAAQAATQQLTPNYATPRPVDVEMLLAASTLDQDTASSSAPPAIPSGSSVMDADDWEPMTARAGMALITLGFVFLIGSLLASRLLDPGMAPIRRA
jgi:hypothetical protein